MKCVRKENVRVLEREHVTIIILRRYQYDEISLEDSRGAEYDVLFS